MAEVAATRVPDKSTLDDKFDEVFGAGEEWGQEAPVETQPETQEVVEEAAVDPANEVEVAQETETEQTPAETAAEEVTQEVLEAKPKGKKDAESRIRSLAGTNKQLRDELSRTQAYFQNELTQLKRQAYEEQRSFRETQEKQLELQKKQFDILNSDREAAEFERLPLDKKIELRSKREATAEFRSELEKRDREWKARFDAMEQKQVAEKQAVERQKRLGGLDNQAERALDDVILKGLPAEQVKTLRGPMKEMLMAWCGAYGEYPSEAAPRFAKYIDNMHNARLQAKRKPGVVPGVRPVGTVAAVAGTRIPRKLPAKRTIQEALKQNGLRGPLNDLADELFGRD